MDFVTWLLRVENKILSKQLMWLVFSGMQSIDNHYVTGRLSHRIIANSGDNTIRFALPCLVLCRRLTKLANQNHPARRLTKLANQNHPARLSARKPLPKSAKKRRLTKLANQNHPAGLWARKPLPKSAKKRLDPKSAKKRTGERLWHLCYLLGRIQYVYKCPNPQEPAEAKDVGKDGKLRNLCLELGSFYEFFSLARLIPSIQYQTSKGNCSC
nr:hypothetical protein [Tanacetum cinerariifolium]